MTKISVKHPDGSIHEVDIPEELPPNQKGEVSPDTKEELRQLDQQVGFSAIVQELINRAWNGDYDGK